MCAKTNLLLCVPKLQGHQYGFKFAVKSWEPETVCPYKEKAGGP